MVAAITRRDSLRAAGRNIVLALALLAIAWPNEARPQPEAALASTNWRLVSVGAFAMPGAGAISFSADQMTGRGPCNRFFATYRQFGQKLEIDRLGSTKVACPGQGDKEKALFDALATVAGFRREHDGLSLTDKSGTVMIRLAR